MYFQHFYTTIVLSQCMDYSAIPEEIDEQFAHDLNVAMVLVCQFCVKDCFRNDSHSELMNSSRQTFSLETSFKKTMDKLSKCLQFDPFSDSNSRLSSDLVSVTAQTEFGSMSLCLFGRTTGLLSRLVQNSQIAFARGKRLVLLLGLFEPISRQTSTFGHFNS